VPDSIITGIAHVIQLAVAPVFLLSGIAAMLSVMMARLARIVDRARVLETLAMDHTPEAHAWFDTELSSLARRARSIGFAITLCTMTALLVCAVIVTLFMGAFVGFNPYVPVAVMFILAMLSFFFGLLWFLREVLFATGNLRIGRQSGPPSLPPR
jgi:hypothetical protein